MKTLRDCLLLVVAGFGLLVAVQIVGYIVAHSVLALLNLIAPVR